MISLLTDRAPGLSKVLREHNPYCVLLDGTLAECDRVGGDRTDYYAKRQVQGQPLPGVRGRPGRRTGNWVRPEAGLTPQ
ncbi:hypothetical protein ACWGKW_43790 [Streptomyces sp. NPDC054766]